jgi:tetratricopeptide (TPR) repeat protein
MFHQECLEIFCRLYNYQRKSNMDEQRRQAYLQLIYVLLKCTNGQEMELLEANPNLVDGGLLKWMALVAADLAEKGNQNAADWLLNFASQLAEALGISSSSATREEYFAFLRELLNATYESNGNPQAVYPVLQLHLDKLDMYFAHILQEVATGLISQQPENAESIIALIENISISIQEFPLGNIADNQEIAIAGYAVVLQNREENTEKWAQTQNNLGNAYSNRIKGDKADNLELAIAAYTKALQVRTPQAFPQDWAATQNNLGNAYSIRIKGDKADNLELAIAAFTKALQVKTPQAFPQDWAMTQNNLGNAYSDRIKGDKADNLELAIAAFTKALQVRTPQALPYDWARTQNNLGLAYNDRIKGDKADNLELTIAAYTMALQVLTPQAFPQDWATTQNNLGNAYKDRIKGDKADNLEFAIAAYTMALQVLTPQAFPQYWAMTQNSLGIAYRHRIKGDKADNLELAIATYILALQVRTPQAFPQDWAMTQNNLGNAYCDRIQGDKADNIEFAIAAFTLALQVYTPQAFPQDWATTQNNLGTAYWDRIKGDKADNIELAIAAYTQVLQVYTPQAFPQDLAGTQNNLGNAYSDRITGDKTDNIELAIFAYTQALQIYTPDAFPIDCLRTSRSLGNLVFDIKNWQLAIESYEKAMASVERSRNWATTDKRRHEILKEAIDVYEKMVQACINNGQLDKAIEYSERSRSKTLGDIMASNRYFEQGEIDLELKQAWQKYDDLQQQINLLTLACQTAETQLAGTRSIATPESLQADKEAIKQLEFQKQQTWQELRRRDPVLAGQLQVDPLNLSQIQRLIDNDKTALLSFYTTENDTHIFILLKDRSPQIFTCEGQGVGVLQDWLGHNWSIPYLKFRNTGNWEWKDKMGSVLAELSGRLQVNELIAKYLNGIEELIIVPHLMLHQIPFAALPVGDPPQPPLKRGGQEASDACESLLPCAEASDPPQPPLKRGGQEASDACESLLPNAEAIKIPPVPPLTKGGLGGFFPRISTPHAGSQFQNLNPKPNQLPPQPNISATNSASALSPVAKFSAIVTIARHCTRNR